MSYFGKFLLIENDGKILDHLLRDKGLMDQYPSTVVRSFSDAAGLLGRNAQEFRMVFLSEKIARHSDLEEIKKTLASHPEVKLALLEDKDPHGPVRELVHQVIPTPKSYMDLVRLIQNQVKDTHDWRKNQNDGQEKDKEIAAEDNRYMQIPLRDFVVTPKSYFNFYLRLSPGKYIKVFNAGDELTKVQFDHYRSKGIDEFFVPKEEHEKFIRLQGALTSKVVTSDAATGVKVKSLMKLGANVTVNLLKCGITPDRMDNAQLFLDQSILLLRNMKMKNDVVANYLKNIDTNEHTAAVAFIAGILANHLGFESSKSIKVVGTTALLHDIGLYDLDPQFVEGRDEDAKSEIFEKHPAHGAELLRRTGTFDEVICHAIENHHRRRKGEIATRRSNSVNLVTEIVSVADEFFNVVISQGFSPDKVKFFVDIELKNYSPNVERAFQLLMKGKKAA